MKEPKQGSLFGINTEPTYKLWDSTKPSKIIIREDLVRAIDLAMKERYVFFEDPVPPKRKKRSQP